MKIAFFQYDLGMGGIQRSLLNLLHSGILDQAEVDVYYFQEGNFYPQQETKKNAAFHLLPPLSRLARFVPFGLLWRMNREYRHWDKTYDLAVDFNSYQPECALAALRCPAKQHIMWIHNDVEQVYANEVKYRVLWHFFRDKLHRFDRFVGVSPGTAEPFRRLSGLENARVDIMPNWIDVPTIHRQMACQAAVPGLDEEKINLVTVGRLCHQKGLDLLLSDFAAALVRSPKLELWVIGDGPDRKKLEALAQEQHIREKVHFLGGQPNPFAMMRQMDGLVLNSRYEGQGMVLWEAKAVGLPLYFPERLEKYNEGLSGVPNMSLALAEAGKARRQPEDLEWYLDSIRHAAERIFQA